MGNVEVTKHLPGFISIDRCFIQVYKQKKAIALKRAIATFSTDNRGRKAYFIVAKTGEISGSVIWGANNPLA